MWCDLLATAAGVKIVPKSRRNMTWGAGSLMESSIAASGDIGIAAARTSEDADAKREAEVIVGFMCCMCMCVCVVVFLRSVAPLCFQNCLFVPGFCTGAARRHRLYDLRPTAPRYVRNEDA